ncbi:MAG: ATP-binding cassette domain-containing protein [Phycisphaeraceae bacterium]
MTESQAPSPDLTASSNASAVAAGDAVTDDAIVIERLSHTYPSAKKRRKPRGSHDAQAGDNAAVPAGPVKALDDVNLAVKSGEIFGILGPNGSGKTTLFRILSTLLRPSAEGHGDAAGGIVRILGHDCLASPAAVRGELGVVFQSPSLDGKLTARENLTHQGRLYGLAGPALGKRIDDLLIYFGLAERAGDYVETFSGGMRRRVELAKALLHEPKLLLLDEPATGLDPGARLDLWKQLHQLRDQRGQTIALTTHLMEEAEKCDRLAIMAKGKVVAVDTPAALKARIGGDVITLSLRHPQQDPQTLCAQITERFAPWPQNSAPLIAGEKIRLEREGGTTFIAALAEAFPGRFGSITVGQPTLDDVFLHLTGHALWGE